MQEQDLVPRQAQTYTTLSLVLLCFFEPPVGGVAEPPLEERKANRTRERMAPVNLIGCLIRFSALGAIAQKERQHDIENGIAQ
jgi:hypothetical protein